jgi:hypothetical protein
MNQKSAQFRLRCACARAEFHAAVANQIERRDAFS